MRRLLALVSLAGCDIVLGLEENPRGPDNALESATHDEDGDDTPDRFDLCPHVPVPQTDVDGDGIGDDCDPRPTTADVRYFFAFEGGHVGILQATGTHVKEMDAIVLGLVDDEASLVLDVATGTADIEADVTIVKMPPLYAGAYAEVGLFSVHRRFTSDHKERGDNCFFGTDMGIPDPSFLEFNNDDRPLDQYEVRFPGSVADVHGTFTHARTPEQMRCSFSRSNGTNHADGGPHENAPRDLTGKVAVTTHLMAVRFAYLWVVTPRP